MSTDSPADMVNEVQEKLILHWNYRGLTEMPEVVRNYGIHIREIYLKWNQLQRLPLWVAELTSITNLYLHGNQILKLPDELGEMSQLNTLDLGQNKLSSLPGCIGRLRKLKVLLLNNNCIETLPPGMSKLESLETLSIPGNKLVALPEWLGSLPNLEELVVDRNYLQELPNRLTLAPRLSAISVCSNRLRYLPLNGFVSAPCIRFDYNPNINYLSIPAGYQLDLKGMDSDLWDIPAYGCFDIANEEDYFKSKMNIRLNVSKRKPDGEYLSVITLPRQLLAVYKINENEVVSLWEMALRRLYCSRFKHILNVKLSNVEVIREQAVEENYLEVTGYAESLLKNGPVSICLNSNCQESIFTEAWVAVGSRRVLSLEKPILTVALFCSRNCVSDFIRFSSMAMDYQWDIVKK